MVGVTPANITRLRLAGETDTQRATGSAPSGTGSASLASPAAGQTAAAHPGGADNLRLSAQAQALPAGLLKGAPVDSAMVERLGTAIAEGRYPLDPERIAQAICADCFDLPS